jgi:hypothetical protein
MSTRGVYIFSDKMNDTERYAVYKHHDNYPEGDQGAARHLWEGFLKAWSLPRYEADEAAASFVAANKDMCGGVRLMTDPDADHGQEYVYKVFQAPNGQIILKAFEYGADLPFFYGRLKDFIKKEFSVQHHEAIDKLFHGEINTSFKAEPEVDANKVALRDALTELVAALGKAAEVVEKVKKDI